MGKILKYLKPYRWLLILTLTLVAGQAVADLYLPTLMSEIVNQSTGMSSSGGMQQASALLKKGMAAGTTAPAPTAGTAPAAPTAGAAGTAALSADALKQMMAAAAGAGTSGSAPTAGAASPAPLSAGALKQMMAAAGAGNSDAASIAGTPAAVPAAGGAINVQSLMSQTSGNVDVNKILETGALMLIVTLASAAAMISSTFLSSRISMGFGRDLRSRVFARVSSFSLHEFDELGSATLITRATNDITQVQTFIMIFLRMIAMAPIMCVGGVIMGTAKDPALSLILVVVVPILGVALGIVASKGLPLFRKVQEKVDRLNLVTRESITGIRVVRAFDRVAADQARFHAANEDLATTSLKAQRVMVSLFPIMMFAMNATTIAIIWFGGIRIDAGDLNLGDMMAFMQYAMQILFSLIMVSMMFVFYPRASVSGKRIAEVLGKEPEIRDPAAPRRPRDAAAGEPRVEFRHVTFSYPGAEEPAITDISFQAMAGQTTAVIGGTGSGKSTLAGLVPRFYDVDSGSILVDGVDVREMTQHELRSRIGYVPQKAVLFSGSVADNIRFGKADATDEEVAEAARIAQADGFVRDMPEGYASLVSQGGTNVSGGQKQRLSIARALVRRPEIYILDDSFSALDFKTDARLRAELRKATRDATVIIVAQRVSTVMDADRIIVLDEGRVVGEGSHAELYGSCPVYKEIVDSQLSQEELA